MANNECIPPGWGTGYTTLAWGHTSFIGTELPTHPPYDVFCIGPCEEMAALTGFTAVTLTGTYYLDVYTSDLVIYSLAGYESKLFIDSSVPTDYTLTYTVYFESLPPSLSYPDTHRAFIGVYDDNGSSTGLYFAQSGIAFTSGLDELIVTLPDSLDVVREGKYYTVLIVVSSSNNTVFIHITSVDDLDKGYGHELRWVLTLPGQTLSKPEGFTLSVLGDSVHNTRVLLDTVCLASGEVMPDRPPIADAGNEQEARLCTFVQLDGSGSYDTEGAPITYNWRLIDAPSQSAYVVEAYDGSTSPEAVPNGFTDELSSGELEAAHTTKAIVAGDVVVIDSAPYGVVSVATGPFVIYVDGSVLPDNLSSAPVKLLRQADCFPDGTAQKPLFYPDAAGFWKFDLSVNDGSLESVDRSAVVVHIKESLVASGVTPGVSFLWNYMSDFWRLVEDRERIEVVWSAIAQIVGANLMSLWQIDYNKSLRDIQRSMQRRWMYYDLLIQEPFVALTTVARMDNTAGFLVGSDGLRLLEKTYEITANLAGEDIQEGDFLILDGLGYKIAKYQPVALGVPNNRLITYGDFPAGIADYQIARASSSTQINFYEGLVAEDDNIVLEVITKSTGEFQYFSTEVMGVSESYPDKILLDPTPVLAYLDDPDTYSVYLSAVFRRKYVPINERIVDIPRLQQVIKDPPEGGVLHRGVDFFLETFRDIPCIRWQDVWKYYDENAVLQDDPTPPARLWAETTYIENLSTVEANFGILADFTLDDHAQLIGDIDYLSAVKGLWYVRLDSPSLYNVRVGTQILLGLPFAEEAGVIQEIRDDIVSPTNTIFILDDGEDGIVRSYSYPAGLALEENPGTGVSYAVGDSVDQFAPIVRGVTVVDYKSDPSWFKKFVSQGVYSEVQKFHKFGVEIDQGAYTMAGASMASKLVRDVKPTYAQPIVSVRTEAKDIDIDVNDLVKLGLKVKLFDGICFFQALGHARMWDEPDPSPMRMTAPPSGGTPEYDHERIPGVYSPWQSGYDQESGASWRDLAGLSQQNITSTPVSDPPWAPDKAVATIDLVQYRILTLGTDGPPDNYDANPLYEVALRKNGLDAFVFQFDLTGTWSLSAGIYQSSASTAVTPNVVIDPATDTLEVVVRPQGGSSNTPKWYVLQATFYADFEIAGQFVWGYDRHTICPESTAEALLHVDWPGGVPDSDNPLFETGQDIYDASIVGGHVVLGVTPVSWNFVDPLAAGQYGRRVTL